MIALIVFFSSFGNAEGDNLFTEYQTIPVYRERGWLIYYKPDGMTYLAAANYFGNNAFFHKINS